MAERARAVLFRPGERVAVVYHADADGISAAALAAAALERTGAVVSPLAPGKGEDVYDAGFRARVAARGASALLVLDTGSRPGVPWDLAPTVIVDHHVAAGPVTAEAFVHDAAAASTSVMTLALLEPMATLVDRAWLAALGALGDRGDDARALPEVQAAIGMYGVSPLREAVALINASGRASEPRPEVALAALRSAAEPRSVSRGSEPLVAELHRMRAEVAEATQRARRVAPRVVGRWAVVEIHDACRIHGIVASTWSRRLAPRVVLVANTGYVAERVHLAVRAHADLDLRAALRAVMPGADDGQIAGHARATGAIVDRDTYARLLASIARQAHGGEAA